MALRRTLSLTAEQRGKLARLRDTGAKPHLRERAAALIKIGDGLSAYEVARSGLLKPRDVDTIYAWLDRFEEGGIDGLDIRPGRGRKPAFSPSAPVGRGRPIRDHARGRA
jgi:hypothetical protein